MPDFIHPTQIPEPPLARVLFADTRFAWVWLLLRLYVGYEWLAAGWEKVQSSAWVGAHAGSALQGFILGALQKAGGGHPDVSGWYAWFLQTLVLPHPAFFSYLVTLGELAVGLGLALGLFTGLAAFFGSFMNLNYLFAGTVSVNPLLFFIQIFLILAWRVAGSWGLDRYLLPRLGVPWNPGPWFRRSPEV